jgi:hypothetical protein
VVASIGGGRKGGECGIHTILAHLAHEEGVGWKKKTALLLISVLLVVVQMTALEIVVLESSFPYCNHDDECSAGNYCGVWGECLDCGHVLFREEHVGKGSLEDRGFDPWEDAPDAFQASLAFCNQTDTMPLRCDHLVNNRQRLSFGGACMLALVSILAIIPTVVDLDQMGDEAALVASLSPRRPPESSGGGKAYWVCSKIQEGIPRLLYFLSRTWRNHCLQPSVVGASAALLLSNEFTSQSFLLNGMAISFVSQVDDMVALFVVPQALLERTQDASDAAIAGGSEKNLHARRWAVNRGRGLLWAAALVGMVICCEEFIHIFGNNGFQGQASCTDIKVVCNLLPYFVSSLVLVVEIPLSSRSSGRWIAAEIFVALLSSFFIMILSEGLGDIIQRRQMLEHVLQESLNGARRVP